MKMKKLLSLFLALTIAMSMWTGVVVSADNDFTRILACSDFQHEDGNDVGKALVSDILGYMADDGITSADGLLACGDYDDKYDEIQIGINDLKDSLKDVVTENMVFVQGNHDEVEVGTNGLSPSGNNDPAHGKYGVWVIHEDEFPWYGGHYELVKRNAQKMIDYLNEKLAQGFDKPIFVLTHIPFTYSLRTLNYGDGMHGNYLFDALNEAAGKGLNIVFMFGHNHSSGYDDYMGGGAVFLKKGDTVLVPQNSKTEFKEETLNFTFMTAGYVGYYKEGSDCDGAVLSISNVDIYDDKMVFSRYTNNGKSEMKAKGSLLSGDAAAGITADLTVYESPYTIELTPITDRTPIKDLFAIDKTGEVYEKISKLSEIKDGGKYLMIHKSDADSIMTLNSVEKTATVNNAVQTRVGFDLVPSSVFIYDHVRGQYSDKIWTITKNGSKYLIGDGTDNIKLKRDFSGGTGMNAFLDPSGNEFDVSLNSDGYFTFKSGTNSLCYHESEVITGGTSVAASISLFEYKGYSVDVTGGTASSKSGPEVNAAFPGESVLLTATGEGEFERWVVEEGDVEIDRPEEESTMFSMTDGPVVIKAVYKSDAADVTYGDVNADGTINVNDAVLLTEYIGTIAAGGALDVTKFPGGEFPGGLASAKLTADEDINVNDAVILVEYIGTMAAGGTLDPTKFPNGTFPGAAN